MNSKYNFLYDMNSINKLQNYRIKSLLYFATPLHRNTNFIIFTK